MAGRVLPQKVADSFVEQYFAILNKCPENLHKFYQDSSSLGWPDPDGIVTPVTTLSGISDNIMSSDYTNWHVVPQTVDVQESLEGGVLVVVTGLLMDLDIAIKNFSHTFVLAKQEKGFFVLNDILRIFDKCVSTSHSSTKIADKIDLPASFLPSPVPCIVSDSSATKALVKTNAKEVFDLSNSKDTDAKVVMSASSVASSNHARSVLAPTSNFKDEQKKISYASMVAKTSLVSSPKTVEISSKAVDQVVSPSMNKVSAPRGGLAPKALAHPSNVAPKLRTVGNGVANTHAFTGGRGIYIGNLPNDTTKKGVADVVKQFGPIRRSSDSIQIRRYEDGFCCAFVEFESADAAHCAVELHHVKVGEKEAYITYKRSSHNRENNDKGRSPSKGEFQNGNLRGQENDEVSKEGRSPTSVGTRGRRRGRLSNQWSEEEDGWKPVSRSN